MDDDEFLALAVDKRQDRHPWRSVSVEWLCVCVRPVKKNSSLGYYYLGFSGLLFKQWLIW